MHKCKQSIGRVRGFTLIELLVVFAIVALLVSMAVPRYFASMDRSRESVLRYDLSVMRQAIDKYYGDLGAYPESLKDLVERKYLKAVPQDPVTRSHDTWVLVPPTDGAAGGVQDIKSGAAGQATDGTNYADW